MLKANLGNPPELNQALLDEFKIQDDVKMYIQLPGYGDFHGFDLPNGAELAAISQTFFTGFAKP